MSQEHDLGEIAQRYHDQLPSRIRRYLLDRGISDALIDLHLLGWNGWRITIPIFDREGRVTFFKLARDPEGPRGDPKMLASRGSRLELYGWERVLRKPPRIVICEGEFDRLVLEAHGLPAVTSTGGAGTFREEWVEAFAPISEVFVCFDRDQAGRKGALRVARFMPQAKIVDLPVEIGEGGDVTDFFVRFGRSRDQFVALLEQAAPAPPASALLPSASPKRSASVDPELRDRIDSLKRACPIERVIGQRIPLTRSGSTWRGLCPFHEDHRPSLTVYSEQGAFHCYGCGMHGDAITFIREYEHLSFTDALEALARYALYP
jgi:DNA primase